jgi:hypothetical protein
LLHEIQGTSILLRLFCYKKKSNFALYLFNETKQKWR